MSKLFLVAASAALLSACGSSVKLSEPAPVEDKVASAVAPAPVAPKPAAPAAGQQSVASVDLNKASIDAAMQKTSRLVYFDFDSFVVKSDYQPVIEAHGKYVRANKAKKVSIEGHADERGGREYNLALGQKRAEAVRRALNTQGADDNQLEAVSYGEEKPAVQGSNEAAWEKNRRAEIVYK